METSAIKQFIECYDMFKLVCAFLGNNDLLNCSSKFSQYKFEFGYFQLTCRATEKFLTNPRFRTSIINRVSDWENQIGFWVNTSLAQYIKTDLEKHVYKKAIKYNPISYLFNRKKMKRIIGVYIKNIEFDNASDKNEGEDIDV